jgi:hypothetical protein
MNTNEKRTRTDPPARSRRLPQPKNGAGRNGTNSPMARIGVLNILRSGIR